MHLDGPASLESVNVDLHPESPLLCRDTGIATEAAATPSDQSYDDMPEFESSRLDEEEIDRTRALPSTTSAGGMPDAITVDKFRTRHQVLIL